MLNSKVLSVQVNLTYLYLGTLNYVRNAEIRRNFVTILFTSKGKPLTAE